MEPKRFWKGVWRLADPKITLASVASLFVGLCAAAHHGPISWGWLLLTVFGIFSLEAAKNGSGEIFDFDSGADQAVRFDERSPFSGGKRVLVDQLLSRKQTVWVSAFFYAVGIAIGVGIVLLREPHILWIGFLGVTLAYFYHAPPFCLSYRGLGEFAVALTYGPLIALGAYWVQRHTANSEVIWASVPVGLLIAAFLWINEFPDASADAQAGKRTLVVRLGKERARICFSALIVAGYGILALLPTLGLPTSVWLGTVGLPFGVAAARRVWAQADVTPKLIPAQGWALLAFLLTALGEGTGFLLSP